MSYVIYGAGAIGSVLGAHLVRAGRRVTLIARPAHVAAIRMRGLTIRGTTPIDGLRIDAVERFADARLGTDTIILLTMKTNDTAAALDAAGDALSNLPVVCFQNGVHNERLATERGLHGYGGVVRCPATFIEPGIVTQNGPAAFGIGRLPAGSDALCDRVAADLRADGLTATVHDDIMAAKWSKVLTNLSGAYLAVTGLSLQQALASEASRAFMADLLDEGVRALNAGDIRFESPDSIAQQIAALRAPGDREVRVTDHEDSVPRPSVWQDLYLRRGKTEVDYRNGEIVRLGAQVGVPTPLNALLVERCRHMARERIQPGAETLASLRASLAR